MSKAKPKTKPKSHAIKIFEYMQKRGVEVTREEIAKGTGLTRDQVKVVLHRFKMNEVVSVRMDEENIQAGVPYYTLHPNAGLAKHSGIDVIKVLGSSIEEKDIEAEEEAAVINAQRQPLKESDIDRQGENAKSFMYQQGYSQGYNDAMFHSHRDAYNAGRKVVVEGLMKLLKIDAKVLMS